MGLNNPSSQVESQAAYERAQQRRANPHFERDAIWLGLPVPKTQPWQPPSESEKRPGRARRRAIY